MTPQDSSQDLATIVYRLNALEIQTQRIEARFQQWQEDMKSYVSIRENDLRIQAMKTTAERFEADITSARMEIVQNRKEIDTLKSDLSSALFQAKADQDKAQIRNLIAIVSTCVTLASGILIALFTHVIGP